MSSSIVATYIPFLNKPSVILLRAAALILLLGDVFFGFYPAKRAVVLKRVEVLRNE